MDFYNVMSEEGQYFLGDDDAARAVGLTNEQIGVMADRLSELFQRQRELKLAVRIYMMAYYSNGKTEYISLKQRPSFLITAEMIRRKFGEDVVLDGFATTFLEGEEENRVWIGEDGAVENRGESQEKVKELLEIIVDGLNQPSAAEILCAKWQRAQLNSAFAAKTAFYFHQEDHLADVLDRNHIEINYLKADDKPLDFADVSSAQAKELALPLLAKNGCFILKFDLEANVISLYQQCYQWEKAVEFSALTAMLEKFWQEEGLI